MTDKELIKDSLKRKVPVNILHNDYTGKVLFSVESTENEKLWLNSFKRLQNALNYCDRHGLEVIAFKKDIYGYSTAWI